MKILVAYATMSGTAMLVAQAIENKLNEVGGHQVEVKDMMELQPADLLNYELVFLGSSTWDDGRYNDVSREFFGKLHEANIDLSAIKLAVFGLGDQFYPHFCEVVDLMKAELEAKGGKVYSEIPKVDGFPDDPEMERVQNWAAQVATV